MKLFFRTITIVILFCSKGMLVTAQSHLKPGFEAPEYLDLLTLVEVQATADSAKKTVAPTGFQHVFESSEIGLQNRLDVWLRPDNVGVINIRGTINKPASWLENFYSGMIPAIGSLQLDDTTVFRYKLATDSGALVHVGWTLGLAYLAPLAVQQIKLLYAKGVREFIIMGHSQGGALAFLMSSYLHYLDNSELPKDIVYKTYCSAAPKPGNLYYAYDFDNFNRGGWGLRVVNTMDWVPETPFSIQTLNDLNATNPFIDVKQSLKTQKWYIRWYIMTLYRKMDRSTRKAMERYQNYLGKKTGKMVKKILPNFKQPEYANSMNYMTAGVPIILQATPAYKQKFVFTGKNIFLHHLLAPYRYLVNYYYPQSKK